MCQRFSCLELAMRWALQVAFAGSICANTVHAATWPVLPTPEGAQVQTVASEVVLNGVPSRVVRFEVNDSAAGVLQFYRQQFGAQRVENKVQGHQIIATRQGDHFHTVQIKTVAAQRVHGTIMTSVVPGRTADVGAKRSAVAIDTEKLLPPDSSVLTQMQSNDDGKRALLMLATNQAGVRSNRDHVLRVLQQRGFRLVKEQPSRLQGREVVQLMLDSPAEEAMVTISDAGGHRSVLINRTSDSK